MAFREPDEAYLCHWLGDKIVVESRDVADVVGVPSTGSVLWLHWDEGFSPGSEEELREYLEGFIDAGTLSNLASLMNLTLPWSGGGFRELGRHDREVGTGGLFFDVRMFEVAFSVESGVQINVNDLGKDPRVLSARLAGFAPTAELLLTSRTDPREVALDGKVVARESSFHWSGKQLVKSVRAYYTDLSPTDEPLAGDLLAILAMNALREATEMRTWYVAFLEELESAQLQTRSTPDAPLSRQEIQARYEWLLSRTAELRESVSWRFEERTAPIRFFGEIGLLEAVEARRRRELQDVIALKQDIRAAIDLLSSILTAEVLELTRQDQERAADLQRAVTYVSAVLLAPALMAAIFGALPAVLADCPTGRFVALLAGMLAAGIASYIALTSLQRPDEGNESPTQRGVEDHPGSKRIDVSRVDPGDVGKT